MALTSHRSAVAGSWIPLSRSMSNSLFAFGVLWIVHHPILVKPMFAVQHNCRRRLLITVGWLAVDSFNLVDV
jgi:hypothetical protein